MWTVVNVQEFYDAIFRLTSIVWCVEPAIHLVDYGLTYDSFKLSSEE